MNSPSIRPTRTSEIGPLNGMSLIISAADAPITASMSGSFSMSYEYTVAITCVSLRHSFGKRGRRGRSINREERISFVEGRASRRKKPPGILPDDACFSRYSHVSGRKSMSGFGSAEAFAATSTIVSPKRTITEPAESLAKRPVSIDSSLPLMVFLTVCMGNPAISETRASCPFHFG